MTNLVPLWCILLVAATAVKHLDFAFHVKLWLPSNTSLSNHSMLYVVTEAKATLNTLFVATYIHFSLETGHFIVMKNVICSVTPAAVCFT